MGTRAPLTRKMSAISISKTLRTELVETIITINSACASASEKTLPAAYWGRTALAGVGRACVTRMIQHRKQGKVAR